jgi:hypothetical protein
VAFARTLALISLVRPSLGPSLVSLASHAAPRCARSLPLGVRSDATRSWWARTRLVGSDPARRLGPIERARPPKEQAPSKLTPPRSFHSLVRLGPESL